MNISSTNERVLSEGTLVEVSEDSQEQNHSFPGSPQKPQVPS